MPGDDMHAIADQIRSKLLKSKLAAPMAAATLLTLAVPAETWGFDFNACFSRCLQISDAYHCRYSCYYGLTRSSLQSGGQTAEGQPRRKPQRRSTILAASYKKVEMAKSTFSGSESRIAAMNYVNTDCTGGPLPEVRIVSKPSSGELRMEPIKHAVNRDKKNARAQCNGKIVDAMAVFYKSKEQYVGADKVVLDVDFKHGSVSRYTYTIDVR